MTLMKKSEYQVRVTDQVHIHLPSEAFTNEATNFWFGALVGAGALLVVLASMANK